MCNAEMQRSYGGASFNQSMREPIDNPSLGKTFLKIHFRQSMASSIQLPVEVANIITFLYNGALSFRILRLLSQITILWIACLNEVLELKLWLTRCFLRNTS